MVAAITTFQWMFWGFSLAYSRTASPFIGDLKNFGLINVTFAPSIDLPYIPDIVFCFYQLLFAACATMIVVGGSFECGRIVPSLVFSFCWTTIIYCPIACWTWNPNGWLYTAVSRFRRGGPVHIASGSSALAYASVLGKWKYRREGSHKKAHNVTVLFLGTTLIWLGWFGFNGGSALNASMRAMMAVFNIFNTNIAASTGAIGWVLIDYIKHERRFSATGICEGIIAGLVGITPAAGYVSVWCAAAIGFITAIAISLLRNINDWIGIDEGMDVFKLHGMGRDRWRLSHSINGNGVQVGKQFAEIASISSDAFTVLCYVLKYVPGMHLHISDEAETVGLDLDQFFDE